MPIKTAKKIAKKVSKKIAVHKRKAIKHTKDHFVPHKGNNHHPHVLKHRVLAGYSAIIILLKVLVVAVSVVFPKTQIEAMALTPSNILSMVNQARIAASLPALQMNDRLSASARDKANDMLTNQYFSHNSPTGLSPWYWIKRAGYRYLKSAENLAVHYDSAEAVQEGWMASPNHRKNILNPEFEDVGIGLAKGAFEGADTTFVVQHFGKPYEEPITEQQPTTQNPTSTIKIAAETTPAPPPAPTAIKPVPEVIAKEVPAAVTPHPAPPVIKPSEPTRVVKTAPTAITPSKIEKTETAVAQTPPVNPIEGADAVASGTSAIAQVEEAMVAEQPDWTQNLFKATQIESPKLFGFIDERNANTLSHAFYALLGIFLFFSLALGLIFKLHVRKPDAVVHALGVIGLIAFFWVI